MLCGGRILVKRPLMEPYRFTFVSRLPRTPSQECRHKHYFSSSPYNNLFFYFLSNISSFTEQLKWDITLYCNLFSSEITYEMSTLSKEFSQQPSSTIIKSNILLNLLKLIFLKYGQYRGTTFILFAIVRNQFYFYKIIRNNYLFT